MSTTLPPGLTIAPPPPELQWGDDRPWDRWRIDQSRDNDDCRYDTVAEATAFPKRIETDTPDTLRAKLFACSGGIDSKYYQEARRYRAMPDMTWPEARAALNRLRGPVADHIWRDRVKTAQYVALAEFALTAHGFDEFTGLKGEHAVKLRQEIDDVVLRYMHKHLGDTLHVAADHATTVCRPVTDRLHGETWRGNAVLWAMVSIATDRWVQIVEATPDQVVAALKHLCAVHATWDGRRATADSVAARMTYGGPSLPSAAEFADALHTASMLAFTGEKFAMLYAGIMHSMPIYRLYPTTPEREAIELWWPWGRPLPLVDGGPPKPPKPRKQVLDPSIITATRPQDVVREVIEKTGINRTTVQRLTAPMRARMRRERRNMAAMLRKGATKADVARAVGLSPSRVSAMFKGETFPIRRKTRRVT